MVSFIPSVLAAFWLVLYFTLSSVQGNTINSTAQHLYSETGETITLSCTYSSSSTTLYLFWYRQYSNQMQYILLHGAKDYKTFTGTNTELESGKFQSETSNTDTTLTIHRLSVSDSAVYLCALRDGYGNKVTFGTGTLLTVLPKSERTDPSVYKLKSKQDDGLPKSVCLVTDFPNPQTSLKVDGIESSLNVSAVLDKSTNDIWRYSTVVWNNNKDVDCRVQYGDGPEKTPKSDPENAEESCSSLSIDASFRTNPNMNTSSLTVLGFRIVTAKAIIFNLIITLRLWSS